MSVRSLLSADRSQSSSVGVILMVAVTILVGGVLAVFVFDIGEGVDDPGPQLAVEASFDARESLDPHWVFSIRHVSGNNIDPNELEIRLVDNFGNKATRVYPESFNAGDKIRVELWGSPSRASNPGMDCTLLPVAAAGAGNDHLVGSSPLTEEIEIVAVHEPSNTVMDRVSIDLADYPERYGTRLIDGSKPSFDCNDYRWRSGTVVER